MPIRRERGSPKVDVYGWSNVPLIMKRTGILRLIVLNRPHRFESFMFLNVYSLEPINALCISAPNRHSGTTLFNVVCENLNTDLNRL